MYVEHVGIYARDSAALAAWYARILGLKEIRRLERGDRPPVVFLGGERGTVVEILPTDAEPVERDLSSPGFTHLGVVVDDLDAQRERLSGLGVEVWGVRSTSNGWKIGYFRDPEGNTLELVQR